MKRHKDAIYARVHVQVSDVIDYYGRNKEEKARMRRVANSIIQRCRHAHRLHFEEKT